MDTQKLEHGIQSYGTEVLRRANEGANSFFNPEKYINKVLNAAMSEEEVKVAFFRFVDVLPTLRTSAAVIEHVHEYFEPIAHRVPEFLQKGLLIKSNSIAAGLAAAAIKRQVRFVAERFIVGETPEQALPRLHKIRKRRLAYTVDLLGELTVSESEAEAYKNRYLELLSVLSKDAHSSQLSKPIIPGHVGEIAPVNVSVKLSALYSQVRPVSSEESVRVLAERLATIFRRAKELGAFVYVDMEDSALTSIIIETFKTALELDEFRGWDQAGIVLQAYLRRTEDDLDEMRRWVKKRGVPISVRLVKGAYWDTETILSRLHNWPCAVWEKKESSDYAYEKHSLMLLQNSELLRPAFASHNVRSLCHAIKAAELFGVPCTAFELQMLYGMGEQVKRIFVEDGFLVREYAPVGELIPGMGYLVRRLLENTTNEGFLRQSMFEGQKPELLLRKPKFSNDDTGTAHLIRNKSVFTNEPLRDFSFAEERIQLSRALASLKEELTKQAREVHPIIEGRLVPSVEHSTSTSPEDPQLALARVAMANEELGAHAVTALQRFFPQWRATPVEIRSAILKRTAELFQQRREEFTAVMVLEAGKSWTEADADVAEAIDFLHYYAAEADALCKPRQLQTFAGEQNQLRYEPRGICVVISPWNFPLAIPCGMFAAALVTGNCTILKPAEQTPLVASMMFDCFLKAGLPPQAAAFLPGYGESLGAFLVGHPLVSTIAFTGSKAVGLQILRTAGDTKPGFEHVKRVVCEMGGKNAIIVDEDADLDEAVKGVVTSAFGYSGQKCSACSRVLAVGECYEPFLERLAQAVNSLRVGPASDPASVVVPVIDEDAQKRLLGTIEAAKKRAKVIAEGAVPSKSGYYVPPTVFADAPENDPLITDEHFGPLLVVERAKTFAEALEKAKRSEYGLTGGVFSRSPANLERTLQEFCVGNLYINRSCTGALVGRQPFGGAKMSGVGSKAGGPDYLLQFVIPRAITENTLRRGFAPQAA